MDRTLIDYDKNLEELERQREKLEIVMQMMGQEWEESGAGIGWLGQLDPVVNTSVDDPASSTTIATECHANSATATMSAKNDIAVPESEIETKATTTSTTTTDAAAAAAAALVSPSASVSKTLTTTDITSIIPTVAEMIPEASQSLSSRTERPLFANLLTAEAGPSPDYLQSLLNVNEALLAQSLANNDEHPTTPILSPTNDKSDGYGESTMAISAASMMATENSEHVHFNPLRARICSPMITPTKEEDDTPNDESSNNTPLDYMGSTNPVTEKVISPLATHDKPFAVLSSSSPSAKPTTKKRNSYR